MSARALVPCVCEQSGIILRLPHHSAVRVCSQVARNAQLFVLLLRACDLRLLPRLPSKAAQEAVYHSAHADIPPMQAIP